MKKRFLATLMCITMLATSLVGCGNADTSSTDSTAETKVDATGSQETTTGEKKWKLGYSSLAFFDESCKRMADGFLLYADQFL